MKEEEVSLKLASLEAVIMEQRVKIEIRSWALRASMGLNVALIGGLVARYVL